MSQTGKNNNFGKQTAEAILQLYLILIGLGFGFGVEELLKDVNFPSVIRFLISTIMLSTWLHGQIGYGLSETYEVKSGWFSRVAEHYVEILAGLILIIVSLSIQNPSAFYFAVFAAYFLDLILEGAYLLRMRVASAKYKRERDVSRSWLIMDIVSVIAYGGILIFMQKFDGELYIALAFFLVASVIAMWDYSRNRDFYFGLPLKH